MNKTEKKAVEKWLSHMEFNILKEVVILQDEYCFAPSGSNRMDRNNLRTILSFIGYQRAILEED